jgi:hypothetical protein
VLVVLHDYGFSGTASMPNVNLTAFAVYAVHVHQYICPAAACTL